MGAKTYILAAVAIAAPACSDGLKRFAPPGIVKYEELEKGEPPNPAIVQRINAHEEAPGGGFPNLAEQPSTLPEGIAGPERAAMEASLIAERDALNVAIAAERAAAASERERPLETERDALSEALAKDDAAARRERGLPPRDQERELN